MDKNSKQPKECSRCGKPLPVDAPQGLCAACLLLAGVETMSQTGEETAPTLWGGGDSESESQRLAAGQSWGSYRIGRLLGRGGMGEVYEAEHVGTGRRLALKVLRSRLQSPEERARFLREGQMAASVSHPHTVYIFGSEEISDTPVISMELAPGGTLKDRVVSSGPLAPAEAVSAILDIIGGLDAAQSAGILHRDIKPSNCFVDHEGAIKVGDFGLSISTLARDVHHDVAGGRFQGTPQFAPPEQLRGGPLDVRADIYAVGATLYYLLTGTPPFDARNWRDLVEQVTNAQPQSPRLVRPEIPSGLAAIVVKCLAKDPAGRPASYAVMAEALRPFSSTGNVPARLGIRLIAGAIDSVIIALTSTALTALFLDPLSFEQVALQQVWASFPLIAAYFLMEGFWGTTPGKRFLRLYVRTAEGEIAPWGRIFVRHLIFNLPTLSLMALVLFAGSATVNRYFTAHQAIALATSLSSIALIGALFLTSRRHNGWAALHDLASGTRLVVRQRSEKGRPLTVSGIEPLSGSATAPSLPRYGPFEGVSEAADLGDGHFLIGFDSALRRRIWIRTFPTGAPTVSDARRDASRPGRLHWLTGRRSDEQNWDAFEAPDGQPFPSHQTPTPWSTMKLWLLDLANELWAANREDTLPRLNLNRLWIRSDGHLVLLDFPADIAASPTAAQRTADDERDLTPVQLLIAVAEHGFSRNMDDRDPTPLTARAMIDKWSIATPPGIEDARMSIMGLSSTLDRVTSWRRATSIGLTALPFAVMIAVGIMFLTLFTQVMTPDKDEMVNLLMVMEGGSPTFDPLLAKPEYRNALELYLAGRHGSSLTDNAFWDHEFIRPLMGTKSLREAAREIAARHPSVSATELERATALIRPQLEETSSNNKKFPETFWLVVSMTVFTAICVIVWSVLSSVIVPGGFVTRALGLAVVTRTGKEISRWRSVGRALTTWAPALLWPLFLWFVSSAMSLVVETRPQFETLMSWSMGISVVLMVAGAAWAIAHPNRGLHDRLTRTWVVPR